jgi:DNA-binding transcriptional ArsR family regulator
MRYSHWREHTSTSGTAKHSVSTTSTNQKCTKFLQNGEKEPGSGTEKTGQNAKKLCAGQGETATPLSAALWYAGREKPVFPLHSVDQTGRCSCGDKPGCKPGKHPRIRNGHRRATTNPDRIRWWWSKWPDANIGIPTGESSGLLVLDIDDHGSASLDALEAKHGQLPETRTVRTGGGGMHAYFRYPTGSGIRNSTGKVGSGLDVRGEGGYVVAPPSRTAKGPYAFLDRGPLAPSPEWLLDAARKPHRATTDENGAEAGATRGLDGEPIPFGRRGDTLFRIACSLRARGCEYDRILSELRQVNQERCSPPIGAHAEDTDALELEKIAESVVSRYPAGDASPEPPPEVLKNVEALFSEVLERLKWTGRGGPTDRAIYAALLITARRHGQPSRSGIKVYLSVRALALAAGVSRTTAINALDRLREERKLVYRASEGRGTKAGALILRVPQAFTTQPGGGGSKESGQLLRDNMRELLRLRWGPGRVGKTCALYLEVIALTGGATLSEITERTGRRQDNVRRALVKAEARRLVECSGETYRLVSEFAAALANELKATGIVDSERLDRQRYERQQMAYRDAWRAGAIKKARWRDFYRKWEKQNPEPAGFIEDLKPLETLQKPSAPDPVITDAQDPEQLRLLAALAREHIAEYRRKHLPSPPSELAARLLFRLWWVDPDCFAALRHEPRRLAWEVSGRGWTQTLYSGNTMRAALNLLEEPELAAV